MPRAVPLAKQKKFRQVLLDGATVKEASQLADVSYDWGRAEAARIRARSVDHEPGIRQPGTNDTLSAIHLPNGAPADLTPGSAADYLLRPLARSELSPEANRALDDFGYFRYRLFGRKSSPWQENAAHLCVDKLNTPVKEYGVVNAPPGSGKSTLFTHDIPAWLTCRSRSMRGFIGSSTQNMANSYTGRLRNTFARQIPFEAQTEQVALGLAVDAQSTLVQDYGQFNPNIPQPIGAPWSRSQFTVAQLGETLIGEKEATWTAFGRDTGFLGWRVNFVVWDDLVIRARLRNPEIIEEDRRWFMDEAITRLEPGGLFVLQGQRLSAEDMYKFALQMKGDALLFDEDELFDLGIDPGDAGEQKFWHIVYKAHYEEICKAHPDRRLHRVSSPPYNPDLDPDDENQGCLLDPPRLPWRELKEVQHRPNSNYRVVYQQEDSDPESVLVPEHWLYGGLHDGTDFPGCFDRTRKLAEIPKGLGGTRLSVITVDPSPTEFWSIQWWLYVEPPEADRLMGFRYLLDHIRMPLGANDIIDWNIDLGRWTGILEDWVKRARRLGAPITHLIVEQNAAQRFMLQYDWFKRWKSLRSITVRPHNTTGNKSDEEFGIKATRSHFRYGRVRLPGHSSAWRHSRIDEDLGITIHGGVQPFFHELTLWPDALTDDCVMAYWFLEWQLPYLVRSVEGVPQLYNDIPTWVEQDTQYA